MVERIAPAEAHRRITEEGWTHVDVRTVAEFEAFTAATGPDHWELLLRARAVENGINLAVARSYIEELEGIVRPLLPEGEIESVATETWGDNASIEIRLKSADQRTIDPSALADEIRLAAAGSAGR